MATLTPITGTVSLPDGTAYTSGTLIFTLSCFDTEGAAIIGTGVFSCTLVSGAIPDGFKVWSNTAGFRFTNYTVQIRCSRTLADGSTITAPTATIGTVTVGDEATYTLAELLDATDNGTPVEIDYGSIASAVTRSADYGSIA
jgi:hypothetical protein